jgi:FMN-dependent NADH-azoreductase
MSRLLYIEASPRKKRSTSIEVARVFLDHYQQSHPHDQIDTLDLWKEELPPITGDVIDSKYAIIHGQPCTEAQRKAWSAVEQVIARFKQADLYLFSLPMWNFNIPYVLKHFIDVIVQPTYAFTYSHQEGFKGLIVGKPAILIYSSGGAYSPGTGAESLDFQKPYLETILKFIGFSDFHSIIIEPTLESPEIKEQAVKRAKEEAIKLAESLYVKSA